MSVISPSEDPDTLPELTPQDRLREVASIFAAGVSRLKARASLVAATSSDEPAGVIENPLEEPG
jgi:hypothetical protein